MSSSDKPSGGKEKEGKSERVNERMSVNTLCVCVTIYLFAAVVAIECQGVDAINKWKMDTTNYKWWWQVKQWRHTSHKEECFSDSLITINEQLMSGDREVYLNEDGVASDE